MAPRFLTIFCPKTRVFVYQTIKNVSYINYMHSLKLFCAGFYSTRKFLFSEGCDMNQLTSLS